ncbi:ABC transporter substrate-binding protein [Allocoleopsis franciscana]|uniref:Carbohydrate ABC transporter substrate-binding protein, CUT1 family n=1 Tax=Allocoleopsis franciscana PCC 7113 TaxID=1173027 RepID=K9WMM6_9CYAN|nr:ABC transporter substrate-binding protein [Allocoleopsis franciscana]AFZ20797.1 carbohydrate ABC transporter substrate-binding protein, CUT1 family [Allocoleopsis franciscana PCC 7113]
MNKINTLGRSLKKVGKKIRFYGFWGLIVSCILISQFWGQPALTQESVTITALINAGEVSYWKELIVKDFEKENPGIHLEIIEAPNATDLTENLYTAAFILGDSPYDLVYMDVIWTGKFAAAGWLLDLSDRMSEDELKVFMDKDVEAGRYKGKLYRIPLRSDAGMLYYRTDLLEQIGAKPPETFEDLIKTSQQLQEKKATRWGYVWQGAQYEGLPAMFVEIIEGFGGFWVNSETNEVGLDQPEAIKAVEFLRSAIDKNISPPGVISYREEDTRRLFVSGESAFLRNWPYVWATANEPSSEIKGKVGIKPMVHIPGAKSGACLGGWGMGIAKTSKHPQEALKAIQYFTSKEAQRRFTLETASISSRRDLFSDPEIIAKYPHYPKFQKLVESAVLRPPIAQYAQASDILQRYLNAALSNRSLSVEKTMKAAANETRNLLKS